MRILVTGGTGAIGQYVVDELRQRGHEPIVFSRGEPRQPIGRRLEWAPGDVTDVADLVTACQRHAVERVIHLAALLLESDEDPLRGFEINTFGSTAVFEAARRTRVQRVVYASTKAVFGPLGGLSGHPTYRPVREDQACRPRSMYGLSKLLAEQTAAYYRARFEQDIVVVRFGTTCGPNKGARHGASRITSLIIERAVEGVPTHITQGGDQLDDIIYNRDVAHGLVLACLAPPLRHTTYHLGTGRLISLHDLAAAVLRVLPGAQIDIEPGLDYMQLGLGNYCLMSTARARRELGFEPRYNLAEWVADYVGSVREAAC